MSFLTLNIVDDLEFEVIQEDWNIYTIPPDDTVLKLKIVVTKILKTDKIDSLTGLPLYVTGYQNVLSVKSKKKGVPSQKLPLTQEELEKYKKQEVESKEEKTNWNKYKVFDSDYAVLYEIKPIITSIYRIVDLYDQLGYPYYILTSQVISKVRKT